MAIPLPRALPPTVSAATDAVISRLSKKLFKAGAVLIMYATTVAEAEPLIIPQMSPITSLQKFETLSLDFISFIARAECLTLRAAIEWKGDSVAVVTAIPTMSNNMPVRIIKSRMKSAIHIFTISITPLDSTVKNADMVKVIIMVLTTHDLSDAFAPEGLNFGFCFRGTSSFNLKNQLR